jgi:hypothetical protein
MHIGLGAEPEKKLGPHPSMQPQFSDSSAERQ